MGREVTRSPWRETSLSTSATRRPRPYPIGRDAISRSQPGLIGADQEPQSDEILPIWGWWLLVLRDGLSSGLAVLSTFDPTLWFQNVCAFGGVG